MVYPKKIPPSTFLLFMILFIMLTACSPRNIECETNSTLTYSTTPTSVPKEPHLTLIVTPDADAGYTNITPEDLNGMYRSTITYYEFSDVSIEIDGNSLPLAAAIRESKVTVDELIAYARIDAEQGYCVESYDSNLGFAQFSYCYPDYEIFYSHDIFEASNGEKYLIESFSIYPPDRFDSSWSDFTIIDELGNEISLYSEDWGITLQAIKSTSSSLEINCTQKDGIQVGQLVVNGFSLLYARENYHYVPQITTDASNFSEIQIINNSTNIFTLDWSETHGVLSPGDYIIKLYILEKHEPSQFSPLLKNYTDQQEYIIPFTVY